MEKGRKTAEQGSEGGEEENEEALMWMNQQRCSPTTTEDRPIDHSNLHSLRLRFTLLYSSRGERRRRRKKGKMNGGMCGEIGRASCRERV